MAQTEKLDLQNAGICGGDEFAKAQELAIDGKKEAYDLYLKAALAGNPAAAYMAGQFLDVGLAGGDRTNALFWMAYSYVGRYIPAEDWFRDYFKTNPVPKDGELYSYCIKKAGNGNGAAAFMAGMAHFIGMGAEFDTKKAYEMFALSTNLDNADGACMKALCMIRGAGTERDVDGGLDLLVRTANKGCVRAALEYAKLLEHGFGTQRNRPEALRIYETLAGRKSGEAMYEAGRCYLDEIGTKRDPEMAYSWFSVSQGMGYPEGDFGMSRCMLGGFVDRNAEEGMKLLHSSAERGCTEALMMLGHLYEKKSKLVKDEKDRSMECFTKAAEWGNSSAELYLSRLYQSHGPQRNQKRSFDYALRAAAHGSIEGYFIAGSDLLTGMGVAKDEKEGFRLCCIAADEGFMKAQYDVANCYMHGRGVEKDRTKGFQLHRELSDRGFGKSALIVAEAYYHGDGVKQDYNEAFRLFSTGADNSNPICQYYLGDCYDNGHGVKKDPEEAIKWYSKAAAQGHVVSKKILEDRKIKEILEDESPFATFEKSAREGNAQSMYILGRYYEEGIGIERDPAKAREWYTKAKKRGNAAARRALEDMDKKNSPDDGAKV